ncbi:MAG: thioredoxin family protein [Acidimicrobiia bacterium]
MIAVAIDDDADAVRPWVDGITMPVLLDREHVLTEVFAISNVPAVVWIDENGGIARPTAVAFGSDMFKDFTGVDAGPHLDAVRRWVRDGVVDIGTDAARDAVPDLSDDLVRARLHFRIGAAARRAGDDAVSRANLERAVDLAPDDLTIWRAAMPLMGDDPFGEPFFAKFQAWQERGSPFNGLAALTGDDA